MNRYVTLVFSWLVNGRDDENVNHSFAAFQREPKLFLQGNEKRPSL